MFALQMDRFLDLLDERATLTEISIGAAKGDSGTQPAPEALHITTVFHGMLHSRGPAQCL